KKDSFSAFFQNHGFILNAEVPFRLGRAQQLSFGVDVNISAAAEESNQPPPPNISSISARRNEYETYLAYSAILTRSFFINAVGRIVVRQDWEGGRDDVKEILALTEHSSINKLITVGDVSQFRLN